MSLSVSCILVLVSAHQSYLDRIPHGRVYAGGTGHKHPNGGNEMNRFGEDFKRAGYEWTTFLCQLDSDGDGETNGYELGDPDCRWNTTNGVLDRRCGISNPGDVDITVNYTMGTANEKCSDDEYDIPDMEWVYYHSRFMIGGFGILLPTSIIIAMLGKIQDTDAFRDLHKVLLLPVFGCELIGLWHAYSRGKSLSDVEAPDGTASGYDLYKESWFGWVHARLGYHLCYGIWIIQVATYVVFVRVKMLGSIGMRYFHPLPGYLCLFALIWQCATGLQIFEDEFAGVAFDAEMVEKGWIALFAGNAIVVLCATLKWKYG